MKWYRDWARKHNFLDGCLWVLGGMTIMFMVGLLASPTVTELFRS